MNVLQSVNQEVGAQHRGDAEMLVSPAGQSSYFFIAHTRFGSIGMEIRHSMTAKGSRILNTALALSLEEALIQRLENWIGLALDFMPVLGREEFCSAAADTLDVLLRIPESYVEEQMHSTSVLLTFPLPLLLQCSRPDWMAVDVEWQTLLSELILSRFTLSDIRIQSIQPGSVLLVPNAFKNPWNVSIRAQSAAAQCPLLQECQLDEARTYLLFANPQLPDGKQEPMHYNPYRDDIKEKPSAQLPIEICCQAPLSFPANFLLGWTGDHEVCVPFEAVNENTSEILEHVAIKLDGEVFAEGNLVPVAEGWGVLVSHLM